MDKLGAYRDQAMNIGPKFAQLWIEALSATFETEAAIGRIEAAIVDSGEAALNIDTGKVAIEIEFSLRSRKPERTLTIVDKSSVARLVGIPAIGVATEQPLSAEKTELLADALDLLLQSVQSKAPKYFPSPKGEPAFGLQIVGLTDDPGQLPSWIKEGQLLYVVHELISPGAVSTVIHLASPDILPGLAGADTKTSSKHSNLQSAIGSEGKDEDCDRASTGTPNKVTVRPAEFGPISPASESSPPPQSIDLILDVSLQISVELGRATMAIKDILALGPGSVIELDKLAGEAVDILVNDRLIAKGEVVVVDENFGVRVTDIVSPAKRAASAV